MTYPLNMIVRAFGLSALLSLWAAPTHAAQTNNAFAVKVLVNTGIVDPVPGSGGGNVGVNGLGHGLCRNTSSADAFGAHAIVVCSTGALVDISPETSNTHWTPIHGGAYRYITQVSWNGEWVDSIDNSQGTGTITSWRVVHSATHNYLELTLGW